MIIYFSFVNYFFIFFFIFNSPKSAKSCYYLNNYYLNNKLENSTSSSTNSVITSFKLLNVQHEPLVLAGDIDCIVRIFKPDLMTYKECSLVTAFRAFGKLERKCSSIQVGLVAEWDERNEMLLCAGDTTMIRVYDMSKE